jgi:hypothetical protein
MPALSISTITAIMPVRGVLVALSSNKPFTCPVVGSKVGVGSGVVVRVDVGVRVLVAVGVDVEVGVGGTGEGVNVGGTGVEAGAHPLDKTISRANARKTDPIDFFMTLSPFDLIAQDTAQRFVSAKRPVGSGGWVGVDDALALRPRLESYIT